jgi:hypothetical protein
MHTDDDEQVDPIDEQENDPDGLPPARTPLGAALREARAKMRAQGIPFLTEEELDREIAERRGIDARPLGERLREGRDEIRAAGLPELSWDEIEREVAERRGGVTECDEE